MPHVAELATPFVTNDGKADECKHEDERHEDDRDEQVRMHLGGGKGGRS
jgi:hypothetical protein